MSQNTSHAVMQQRHEAHDSLDDFPTPPWATRALCHHILDGEGLGPRDTIWEPACNRGYMAKPLSEYCGKLITSDIHAYSDAIYPMDWMCDFLIHGMEPLPFKACAPDWIITNPPFRLAAQFAHRAQQLRPHKGYAFLVRTSFLEGVDRFQTLFSISPPAIVAQFAERVPMVKGRHDPEASTATSYAWLIWLRGARKTEFRWIPPCRRQLQRPDDATPLGREVAALLGDGT